MNVVRRIVAAVVLLAVIAPVSQLSAAPTPGDRCQKAGRERVTAAGTLRCQSIGGVLRWSLVEGASGGYKLGDVGPGGGIVFYVAPSTFASPGSDCASVCRYLEAAPARRDGEPRLRWASENNQERSVRTATGIGSGMANTIAILKQGGNSGTAADYASKYVNGGKTDWHLPSIRELVELFERQDVVGWGDMGRTGDVAPWYWSSSEFSKSAAWYQYNLFLSGPQSSDSPKWDSHRVRPVRAF